ncbi:hypothetical protein BJ987_002555 [Nocardia goodfellowii]|uniref:Uncharacterized protein n=1 Tax=Nocardia goodfellowii TaxID=882446 RepID=A0ABS4QEZ4_9NOCA|nr:hypothetical protein [Nocardia goodfellowii]
MTDRVLMLDRSFRRSTSSARDSACVSSSTGRASPCNAGGGGVDSVVLTASATGELADSRCCGWCDIRSLLFRWLARYAT